MIKHREMGWNACTEVWMENLKKKEHLKHLSVEDKITSKFILNKQNGTA
jgi:hypothetical protein